MCEARVSDPGVAWPGNCQHQLGTGESLMWSPHIRHEPPCLRLSHSLIPDYSDPSCLNPPPNDICECVHSLGNAVMMENQTGLVSRT